MTNPSEAVRLLPCPFCGGVPHIFSDHHDAEGDRFWVVCCNRGCKVDHKQPRAEAVAAWNRRADHPPQAEEPQYASGCGYTGYEFGGGYLDSTCIDGFLWDLDSCDEPGGGLTSGGDIPCPSCNADAQQAAPASDTTAGYGAEGVVDHDPYAVIDAPFAPQQGVEAVREKVEEVADELRVISLELAGKEPTAVVSGHVFRQALALEAILAALRPSPDSGGSD